MCAHRLELLRLRRHHTLARALTALTRRRMIDDPEECVGDYELREIIGTGSFGKVLLGSHVRTCEQVAIKVLPITGAQANMQRRISSEVATMEKAHVGCPYIVRLHDVLVDEKNIYLVVEYAGGGELFKACFKPIDDPDTDVGMPARGARAREFFQQLVIGLHWCHRKGVAHRDLKPQNLLLSRDGVLKIADFGLAASFNPDPLLPHSIRSLRQTMCGSPLFMAPEVRTSFGRLVGRATPEGVQPQML